MKKTVFILCFGLLCVIVSLQFSYSKNTDQKQLLKFKNMMKLIPVRDSIYLLEGQGGNIGVSVGKDGILLIDDQFGHLYDDIKSKLSEISNQEVKYIINTHWHVDHTNGNENFGKSGSLIIAHKNSRKRMTTNQYIEVFNHHQKPYNNDGLPKIDFDNSMNLCFNNQTINLVYVKNAHTDGDLFVHFTETNVIHTGDVFVTYGYPFIDQPNGGSIQGVISAIDKILTYCDDNTLIIPGHGNLSNKKDLIRFKEMLTTILSRIEVELKHGKSMSEIVATHPTRGFLSQKINEAIFVEIVVNSLKSAN